MQLYWIALSLTALLALSALVLSWIAWRRLVRQQRQYQALLNVLRNEIQAMNSGAIGMGRRLQGVEKRLHITREKQQELENRDPGALAYNQAARLMEMGADVDQLVQTCGIARPEAELMALLHKEVGASHSLESRR